ncbi:MAG: RDD family protein [Caldilineales bacterium]|nr:RDD family protein [Caldilineales bacterium]
MSKQNMQGQYAGCVSRLIAWLIDRVIISVTIFFVFWFTEYVTGLFGISVTRCGTSILQGRLSDSICVATSLFLVGFLFLISPIYMLFFWTLAGQTPGKALVGVRIVRANAEAMSFRVSLRRYLGYILSFIALGLGFVAILLDNQRQAWHDSIAKTYVVYSWGAWQNQYLIERLTKKVFRQRDKVDKISHQVSAGAASFKHGLPDTGHAANGDEGEADVTVTADRS